MSIPHDLSKLTPAEQAALIEQIESRESRESGRARRKARRFVVQPPRAAMLHIDSGQGSRSAVVLMRNLSAWGCSFVHPVFVYPNSRCQIELRAIDGERVLACGVAVRCSLVGGRIHETGMKFDQPLDVCGFIAEAAVAHTDDPAWAEGRQILTVLKAAIDSADLQAATDAITKLQRWRSSLKDAA